MNTPPAVKWVRERVPRVGASFRFDIGSDIKQHLSEFDVVEIIVDQYLGARPDDRRRIEDLARQIPIVVHGTRLSLGTDALPDARYVDEIALALDRLGASYFSEHIAFTRVPGIEIDELLSIPRTEAFVECVARNIGFVKARIGVPILVENVPRAFDYPESTYGEAEFLNRICQACEVGLLLDLENAYANELNFGEQAKKFIGEIELGRVSAIHLAGGEWRGPVFVDDHAHDISEPVMDLLAFATTQHHPEFVVVERDAGYDGIDTLLSEVRRVRERLASANFVLSNAIDRA